ncbi:hypothetical protein EV401DRAFT_1540397 [Pisolithus croceorrhizus]|nr:hypothetical protein EV401DRAFT_1540397 [Pisolithus croceorrhizus]
MSRTEQSSEQDLDFWDFVSCVICHFPFATSQKGPPAVPFWLTECGHVVCNNHLSPDRSCAKCGDQGIELIPLQRNMDPPMSDWFRSLPHAIDGIANAVKFQQQSLATLVQHYRRQCLQLSATCDRLRNERKELRGEVDTLRHEITQLRQHPGSALMRSQEPSTHQNANGKRPLIEGGGQSGSVKTNSSPRSVPTPIAPLRLTLLPGDSLSPSYHRHDDRLFTQQRPRPIADRPGSSRFAEQYAYQETLKSHGLQGTYDQSNPQAVRMAATGPHNSMPPPPTPQGSRFKPGSEHARPPKTTTQELNGLKLAKQGIPSAMQPPSTPRRPFSRIPRTPVTLAEQNATLQSNRFLPGASQGVTARGPVSQTTSTQDPRNDTNTNSSSGRQRMAFLPGSANGPR